MLFASMALLFASIFDFGISAFTSDQSPKAQRHFVFKRQSNACLLGMVPPMGASVQYSQGQGGFAGTNALGVLPLSSSSAGPFPSGTTATMFCLQGGVPTGQSTAFCLNGIWQPPFFSGVCSLSSAGGGVFPQVGLSPTLGGFSSISQCQTNVLPSSLGLGTVLYSNGENQFSGPYPSGTIATLQCPAGQMPSGATTATCLNGIWQPNMLGSCSQNLNAFSSFGTLQQQQQNCPIGPSPPLNGFIQFSSGSLISSYPIGTTATLICNPGFVPSGQSIAICQFGGQFVPSILGPCIANGKRRR